MSNQLAQLRQFIATHYGMDDLHTLCFDLGIDFDELSEGGKTAKVRELLLLMGNQHRYDDLLAQLEVDRPEPFHQADFDTSPETVAALYEGLPTLRKPGFQTDRDLRDRFNMLRNVETTWIDGFLKQSLHMEILKLTHTYQAEAVSRSWGIALRQPGQENYPLPVEKPLREVFDDYGRRLLILGAPGSGKTITLLQLAQQLIQEAFDQPGLPIPVVLNLSSWAQKREPLEDWAVEEMFTQYQVARRISQAWVEEGQLLYLLDGLDEVAEAQREDCLIAINRFLEEHSAEIVVCSRTEDYERLSHRLNLSIAIQIEPLTNEEIEHYLSQDELGLTAVKNTLETDSDLYELAQSPLMLSIMTLAYRNITPEALKPLDSLEARHRHLFSHYVESVFIRRPLSDTDRFNQNQAFNWLTNLARNMQDNNQSIFHIENMQPSLLPVGKYRLYKAGVGLIGGLIIGLLGLVYGWGWPFWLSGGISVAIGVGASATLHNRWSRFVVGGLISWLAVGLIFSFGLFLGRSSNRDLSYLVLTYGGILVFGLIAGTFSGATGAIISYMKLIENVQTLSFSRPTGRELVNGIGRGTIFGMSSGLIFGLIVGLLVLIFLLLFLTEANEISGMPNDEILDTLIRFFAGLSGLSYSQSSNLIIGFSTLVLVLMAGLGAGLIFGLIVGLFGGVFGGLSSMIKPRSTVETLRPNEGVRNSFKNAIRFTLPLGIMAFLIIWVLDRANNIILFPLTILILSIVFLYFGGAAILHHVLLRLFLSHYKIFPLRIVSFCDEMTNRILLRRVGGGWIFIHRYLLEYFASLHQESESNKDSIRTNI